ncbi:CinA family protein [Parabacteroides sp. PF5-9]|uniref:CinA family protein n=1 Tax=Parabacteroides sp. PF5-9 TaxID=1742404 RepID=UPI0024755D88|nr:CinA family protein [Parabacteroides sp. PF5-9]MDH6358649.1 nicotinamide-nucleotide amidase [Parabacteroides sp. PF5-9]
MGEAFYVGENQTVLIKQVGELLKSRKLSVGTAESCTGGRIASVFTSVPGSSAYFVGSIVSYSNVVKHKLLGVSEAVLDSYGAVSQPVVEQMALGIIQVLRCDCAVATSGIAGPDGGSPEKPVGTVWIAATFKKDVVSKCFYFEGDRQQVIQQSTDMALRLLLELLGQE